MSKYEVWEVLVLIVVASRTKVATLRPKVDKSYSRWCGQVLLLRSSPLLKGLHFDCRSGDETGCTEDTRGPRPVPYWVSRSGGTVTPFSPTFLPPLRLSPPCPRIGILILKNLPSEYCSDLESKEQTLSPFIRDGATWLHSWLTPPHTFTGHLSSGSM